MEKAIASYQYGVSAKIEKQAFNVNVDPLSVASSFAGGFLANYVTHKADQHLQEKSKGTAPRIENDAYTQIEHLLRDMKVVFTPVNVIYTVNGQPFEIIRTDEMTPAMRNAYTKHDAEFFARLLFLKMNMQLHLATMQAASNLIGQGSHMVKSAGTQQINVSLDPSLDSFRPFAEYEETYQDCEKIAGIGSSILSTRDIANGLGIGFLPDRVVFLYGGQMIDQMAVTQMNDIGIEAFRSKNKDFFRDTFIQYLNKAAEIELEDGIEKEGAARDQRLHWRDFFTKGGVHPLVYDTILLLMYKEEWYDVEAEALLKQIEVDFELEGTGIHPVAANKIFALQALSDEQNSFLETSLAFEKLVRTMNDKQVDFSTFEENVTVEEIFFALDILRNYAGSDFFNTVHPEVLQYIAEDCFRAGIRAIGDILFEQQHEVEKEMFDEINGYLNRKWMEADIEGILTPREVSRVQHDTGVIRHLAQTIMRRELPYWIEQDVPVYDHTLFLLRTDASLRGQYMKEDGIVPPIAETVLENVRIALYLKEKQEQLLDLLQQMEVIA